MNDLYREIAATAFDVSVDEVTPEQRRAAKLTAYGVLYGSGPLPLGGAVLSLNEELLNDDATTD